jgi:hypothetical protein
MRYIYLIFFLAQKKIKNFEVSKLSNEKTKAYFYSTRIKRFVTDCKIILIDKYNTIILLLALILIY